MVRIKIGLKKRHERLREQRKSPSTGRWIKGGVYAWRGKVGVEVLPHGSLYIKVMIDGRITHYFRRDHKNLAHILRSIRLKYEMERGGSTKTGTAVRDTHRPPPRPPDPPDDREFPNDHDATE